MYISGSFRIENRDKNFKDSNFKALIEQLGKGKIAKKPEDADYTLVAASYTADEIAGSVPMNWYQFFDLIQPPSDTSK